MARNSLIVGCGIQKVGSGQLVLTNSIMSYGGQTVVSNGTLTFAPLGNLTVAGVTSFIAQTNTFLVGSNFTIVNPGILDMSQASNTLWLGKNGFQTLYGNGTLNGNLVMTNLSLVAPGSHANETNIYTGSKLTVSGNMLVTNGGTIRMSINSTTLPTYDSLAVGGTLTIKSAALVVTNVGPASFPGGTSNVFRFFAGSVPVGASLGITNITLPALTAGERYVTNLVLDGSIALVNTNSALNAYPPMSKALSAAIR